MKLFQSKVQHSLHSNHNAQTFKFTFIKWSSVHTSLVKFGNAGLYLRPHLPFTVIRHVHEDWSFRKRSWTRRNLKTPAFRFRVNGMQTELYEISEHNSKWLVIRVKPETKFLPPSVNGTRCESAEIYHGCKRFLLKRVGRKYFPSLRRRRPPERVAKQREKASGTERLHLPFPFKFHQFYWISFSPIAESISCCDHIDWQVNSWTISTPAKRFSRKFQAQSSLILCVIVDITALYQKMPKNSENFRKNLNAFHCRGR